MADYFHLAVVFLGKPGSAGSPQVGCVVQWYNVGLWPACFPRPALDLQLMGDHLCG